MTTTWIGKDGERFSNQNNWTNGIPNSNNDMIFNRKSQIIFDKVTIENINLIFDGIDQSDVTIIFDEMIGNDGDFYAPERVIEQYYTSLIVATDKPPPCSEDKIFEILRTPGFTEEDVNNAGWVLEDAYEALNEYDRIYDADRYWVAGDGNWSDNTNHWSASSGGAPGASKPAGSDVIIIDNGSDVASAAFQITLDENTADLDTFTINCTDATATVAIVTYTLLVSGAYTQTNGNTTITTGTMDFNSTVTVSAGTLGSNTAWTADWESTASVASGATIDFGTGTHDVVGTVTVANGGTLTPNSSTLTFGGELNVAGIVTNSTGTHNCNGGIYISAATANYSIAGATVNCKYFHRANNTSTVTLPSGVLTINDESGAGEGIAQGFCFICYGNANFMNSSGNVTVTTPISTDFHSDPTNPLYDVTINHASASMTCTYSPGTTFSNDLTITAGILNTNASNYDLTVTGDVDITGTLTTNASTCIFTGAFATEVGGVWNVSTGTTTIGTSITNAGTTTIGNTSTINGSAADKPITSSGTWTWDTCTVSNFDFQFTVTTPGTTKTITLGGAITADIITITANDTLAMATYNITMSAGFTNSGTATTTGGDMSCTTFTSSGTWTNTTAECVITSTGNVTISGTYTHGNYTKNSMSGTSALNFSVPIYNLDVTANTTTLTTNVSTIAGALNVTGGTLDTGANLALTVTGNATISATIDPQASTVTVSGSWDSSSATITDGNLNWTLELDDTGNMNYSTGQDFYNLKIGADTKTTTLTGADNLQVHGLLTLGNGGTGGTLSGTKIVKLLYANTVPISISTNFDFGTSTIMYAESTQEVIATSTNNKYYNLQISEDVTQAGAINIENTNVVDSSKTLSSGGYNINIDGTTTISGIISLSSSSIYKAEDNVTVNSGGQFNVSSSQAEFQLLSTKTYTLNGQDNFVYVGTKDIGGTTYKYWMRSAGFRIARTELVNPQLVNRGLII